MKRLLGEVVVGVAMVCSVCSGVVGAQQDAVEGA